MKNLIPTVITFNSAAAGALRLAFGDVVTMFSGNLHADGSPLYRGNFLTIKLYLNNLYTNCFSTNSFSTDSKDTRLST
jgi:hypothetical protein